MKTLLVIFCTFSIWIPSNARSAEKQCEVSVVEHEVISALITEYYGDNSTLLVICSETTAYPFGITDYLLPQWAEIVSKGTVESCIEKMACVGRMRRRLSIPCRYTYISIADFDKIWGDLIAFFVGKDGLTGWGRFERAFPEIDHYLQFTRVGINENQTEAFLFVDDTFSTMGGSGTFYVMERGSTGWTITNSYCNMVW